MYQSSKSVYIITISQQHLIRTKKKKFEKHISEKSDLKVRSKTSIKKNALYQNKKDYFFHSIFGYLNLQKDFEAYFQVIRP